MGPTGTDGMEESDSPYISPESRAVVTAAALVFADYLKVKILSQSAAEFGSTMRYASAVLAPAVIVGMDSRPTGPAIADAVIRGLLAQGCPARFIGVASAPEIMAYAKYCGMIGAYPSSSGASGVVAGGAAGFIYVSASHNPIGHNGIKFGFTDGGVLSAGEMSRLTASLREFFADGDKEGGDEAAVRRASEAVSGVDEEQVKAVYENAEREKTFSLAAYKNFSKEVWAGASEEIYAATLAGIRPNGAESPAAVGIVADLNGSARTASIDRDFFEAMGIPFKALNTETGRIAHRIVPEGESLVPCCRFLEETRRENPAFVLGYVCDCDGDRGNLVIWDEKSMTARPLGAQEVFALSVAAELAHLAWVNHGTLPKNTGVVVNDATSMRVDRIALAFGARVFRAEVGEANVVALAREMRQQGWTIRILGEGAAGGNITHPAAVRDPLATVMAMIKLLTIRSGASGGLYKLWCQASGQEKLYREDFTLSDIIESLPPFVTTSSYEKEAVLQIKTEDHALLKERYQAVFEREWTERRADLHKKYGIVACEAQAFTETKIIRPCRHFAEAGRGGVRIVFFRDRRGSDNDHSAFAFIWMRGSGTERAFRIMADIQGDDADAERDLLAWQTRMVMEADMG